MIETDTRDDVPSLDDVFEFLKDLVGTDLDPDEPLSTSPVESLDIIEWVFVIEESTGMEIADVAVRGASELDADSTPRDIYDWLFREAASGGYRRPAAPRRHGDRVRPTPTGAEDRVRTTRGNDD